MYDVYDTPFAIGFDSGLHIRGIIAHLPPSTAMLKFQTRLGERSTKRGTWRIVI
jgi:hypothetical protein